MTEESKIPDAETRARNVARMREACLMLDAVTAKLDELLAMIEAEKRRSPLYIHRMQKAEKLFEARKQQQLEAATHPE